MKKKTVTKKKAAPRKKVAKKAQRQIRGGTVAKQMQVPYFLDTVVGIQFVPGYLKIIGPRHGGSFVVARLGDSSRFMPPTAKPPTS